MRTTLARLTWILGCGCAFAGGNAEAPDSPGTSLTLDHILSGSALTGTSPSSPAWSPDGRWLAFRWSDPAGSRREVWLVEADGGGLKRLTSESEGRAGVAEFAWLPGAGGLVYLRGGVLWRTDLAGDATRLGDVGEASDLAVSPDGRYASLRKDGDLWLFELAAMEFAPLTRVAVPSISKVPLGRYRRPDVEIGPYVWGGPSYAWSPDGRTIAVHHVDRRELHTVSFPHYLGDETDPNPVRRSYPGDPNERRTVGVLDVASGELKFLDLPDPTANRVVDFSWSTGGRLLVDRESDTAVDRWLHVFDPVSGELSELWHDRRATRVYTSTGSAWHPDGEHVVLLGDLGDRYGLYAVSLEQPEPTLLTNPAFDVTGGPVVTAGGSIYYTSNEPSPHESHIFRTSLAADVARVTHLSGESRPYPSPDGTHLAFLHSDDTSPTELYIGAAIGAREPQRITVSPPPEFHEHAWAKASYAAFPSLDDGTLHARILAPPDIDLTRRHPVIFGPVYSNTVRNRWGGLYALVQQLLVARGYIVVQVDVRGSTGYGRQFREGFLVDFAGKDLDDLESAVRYMETLPYVDPDRIGVWGSSYGGTLTVYALLKKPGLFDAGVAGAAAVDPRFFGSDDVAIVRTPDSHPAAFARGAAQYAENLADPLLLIHGMQDQVVPFKTVVDLAEALMRAGKDFDFAFAPAGTHGWTRPPHYARYLLGKLMAHFDRYLGPGPR